jgi:hypothetical protein
MKDRLINWGFVVLVLIGVAAIWPEITNEWLRILADLPSLAGYTR